VDSDFERVEEVPRVLRLIEWEEELRWELGEMF